MPDGYAFGGLPIRSANLSESDGGFLALFVDGAVIRKARLKGDYTIALLRKVGAPNGYAFPGKRTGETLNRFLCPLPEHADDERRVLTPS